MKVIIVRHAEPDYVRDSLTQKGHREAALAAERLCKVPVKDYYMSPLGRAQVTASYTLKKAGREAEVLPWLAEFRGHTNNPATGKPGICWDFKPRTWLGDSKLYDPEHWTESPLMQGGNVAEIWKETTDGIDSLMAKYGLVKKDGIWCGENNADTIMLFCHFGIGSAVMAYLCNLSPAMLWQTTCMTPSSVTTLVTEERVKGESVFRCIGLGDISHLNNADERYSTAGLFPECYTGRDSTNPPEWDHIPEYAGTKLD